MDTRRRLKPQDYTVAWLCALALSEQVAAISMLDELHEDLLQPPGDDNTYTYGSIKGHNIIVACLPLGQPGIISASILVGSLPKSFPNLRIHLLVGIGGGMPHDPPSADPEKDIHLGDVVIGVAEKPGVTGVVQYDFERDHGSSGRELLGSLDKPDRRLLTALGKLFSLDLLGKSNFNLHMERLKGLKIDFTRPTSHGDRLYRSSCGHVNVGPYSTGCGSCPGNGLILRSERLSPHPAVHQGQILSGSAVIKNTPRRDELRQRFPDARCFEMEAAGVMDQTHCLVIRGIADYADSHKNQHWEPYAAGTAAAFAREFLLIIQPQEVTAIDPVASSQTFTQKDPPIPAAFTPDEKACLQSLHFPEMHWRRNDVADPTPSTCAWLLEHPKYCEWLGQGRGMLWIKGKPGAGNSTVLKYALETAEQETKKGIILAWFFFHGRGAPMQKNILGLFRSLLHQILQKSRELLSKFTSIYKYRCETEGKFAEKWDWDDRNLQSFFKRNVVDAARTHLIRIYIDALDECGEHLATELVEFFRSFAVSISICFSCRHYPFVALEGGNEVCVEKENEQDIESYINDKINTHIQRVDIAQVVRNEMVSRSKGNFQWVVLVLPRVLKMHKSRKSLLAIQTMIRNIPEELNKLYTTLLTEIDNHERLQSLRLMQWICLAFRPLSLTELRFALAVGADTPHKSLRECQSSELYIDQNEDMERIVCDLSKGLAEVVENDSERVVQFVHQSVKDFLLERGGFQILDHASEGTVVGRGHFWLSRSCVKYFLMEEVRDFATFNPGPFHSHGFEIWDGVEHEIPMLNYLKAYFLLHVLEVDLANMAQDDLVAMNFETTDGVLLHSWYAVYQRLSDDSPSYSETLLHIASLHNLIGVVKAILARDVWADPKDESLQTPLYIAASRGHEAVVEMLLHRDDVDVNSRDEYSDTALSIAAERGHEAVVKMLLDRNGVDVNSENHDELTPLSKAAGSGHISVAKLLFERGLDSNLSNIQLDRAFMAAAFHNHYETMKLLLQGTVDVNVRDYWGRTPLSHAATYNSSSDIVKLLLQHNADLDTRDSEGRTPLSHAASRGHLATVELLVQYNADINSKDIKGRTPLSHAATYNSSSDIVKLLLQHNADLDTRDSEGRTPLSHAASYSSLDTVKLLLQHNANIDSKDIKGRTPLSYAASYKCLAAVKLLLEGGSNADQKDEDGRSPFSHAVCCGDVEVAEAFLEGRHIDINSKDNDGRNPLSWALLNMYPVCVFARDECMAVVDLLLKQDRMILTEDNIDAMNYLCYFEGFDFSETKEEDTEEVIKEEGSEEKESEEEKMRRRKVR